MEKCGKFARFGAGRRHAQAYACVSRANAGQPEPNLAMGQMRRTEDARIAGARIAACA